MKKTPSKYIKDVLIGIDQLINAIFCGNVDETLSSRCYRNAQKYWYAKIAMYILDFIFKPWDKEHCKESYESEIKRLHLSEDMR